MIYFERDHASSFLPSIFLWHIVLLRRLRMTHLPGSEPWVFRPLALTLRFRFARGFGFVAYLCADLLLKLALKFTRLMATVARKRLLPLPVRINTTKSTLQQAQLPHQLIKPRELMSFLQQLLLKHAGESRTTIAGSGSLTADCKRRRRPCKARRTLPYSNQYRYASWTGYIPFSFSHFVFLFLVLT